jgi:hypothetical protein
MFNSRCIHRVGDGWVQAIKHEASAMIKTYRVSVLNAADALLDDVIGTLDPVLTLLAFAAWIGPFEVNGRSENLLMKSVDIGTLTFRIKLSFSGSVAKEGQENEQGGRRHKISARTRAGAKCRTVPDDFGAEGVTSWCRRRSRFRTLAPPKETVNQIRVVTRFEIAASPCNGR